jgi:hypothetical protein
LRPELGGKADLRRLNLGSAARAADVLFAQERIDTNVLETVRVLDPEGKKIANSDMHSGNLSFLTENFKEIKLVPVYDMMPMMYAPSSQGKISIKEYRPPTLTQTTLLAERSRPSAGNCCRRLIGLIKLFALEPNQRKRLQADLAEPARN